ncbi:MAG TPA: UbiA-like polyprenyltransferase [Bacteroidales bacterium]|jgi:4-hydroxybenzoate polyprenyltransferase|nr:UbiA-like polyprenyltransferase [Bacteroidales bacterium]HOX76028.1 UbiA-like polyprenyltransferase [Bacteroidales bacterium]HPM87052.1 UbiA-like polyprenyltransferase [Bacteroidales bacterium]HQM69052.1 UbiA-like polyprenyltransferase [Bacteroidales bacterium]
MSGLTGSIKNYLSLVRFSHTVFAMPFALIGFTLAITRGNEEFSIKLLLLIILCMIFARNAAMGFNRIADQRYDALNPRTRNREIPSGKISMKAAIIFVVVNSLLFIITTGFINWLTLGLAPVALAVILGYSLTKRITSLCHFILGLGLSLAPVGAYISVTGQFALLPVIYSLIVLTWVSGFDIIYSLMDDSFDRENNLFSIPAAAGLRRAILISVIIHIITFLLVIVAGILGSGGILFWTGSVIFISLLIYQHLIVRPDDLSRVNLAFGTTNGIASILFAVFVICDLIFF